LAGARDASQHTPKSRADCRTVQIAELKAMKRSHRPGAAICATARAQGGGWSANAVSRCKRARLGRTDKSAFAELAKW
jgi:hypothetical protein